MLVTHPPWDHCKAWLNSLQALQFWSNTNLFYIVCKTKWFMVNGSIEWHQTSCRYPDISVWTMEEGLFIHQVSSGIIFVQPLARKSSYRFIIITIITILCTLTFISIFISIHQVNDRFWFHLIPNVSKRATFKATFESIIFYLANQVLL